MEKSGMLYEAIQFYRRAVQLVPDIEFKLSDASKPKQKNQQALLGSHNVTGSVPLIFLLSTGEAMKLVVNNIFHFNSVLSCIFFVAKCAIKHFLKPYDNRLFHYVLKMC